jgi:selenocysteine lyase/cysteine desulfurase
VTEPLDCQRHLFSVPREVHYLNCAYMGPLPRAAEEAGIAGLRRKALPIHLHPPDFFETSDRLRRLFAGLVGVDDPSRVAIHPGASYGIATAARNLPVARGQNVILTAEQFPGNVYAWTRKAREAGAEVRMVAPPREGPRGSEWNRRLLETVDGDTALVAVPHVHWTDGTRFDLEALGARCREVGAALVVDATQSVGALPFHVPTIRPDVLVVAAYKWLLGPYSVALTYLSPRFDDGRPLEETWIGREGSEDFQNLVDYREGYQPGAIRYDVAERSNFALLPVAVEGLELVRGWTPERIQDYCRRLTADLLSETAALGFTVEEEAWRGHHLFGLRMPPGVDLGELRDALARRNVHVSLRGSALRLSPHLYNDAGDVTALLEVLREAVARRDPAS